MNGLKKNFSLLLSFALLFSCVSCSKKTEREFDNIIVVIGDGMGENHILNAIEYFDLNIPVFMQDQKGYINTNSLSGVTDSAAGGTALATGKKVNNSNIATYEGQNLEQITELAKAEGMKVGVVTTDALSGATPSAFSAHANDRNATSEIITSQIKSDVDLLLGKYSTYYLRYAKDFTANGYTVVYEKEELYANARQNKLFGMFEDVASSYIEGREQAFQLKEITQFAVEYLENENGFFLMVEGAYIDKYSHSNEFIEAMSEVRSLIDTIAYLYEYAEDGNTAIFITADHETGGLQKAQTQEDFLLGQNLYTKTDHTNTPVPLFVKNYAFDITKFGYESTETPENTIVFEACKSIIKPNE